MHDLNLMKQILLYEKDLSINVESSDSLVHDRVICPP